MAIKTTPAPSSPTAAWWAWVLGQAAVLAGYAIGFRWTAGYPDPVDATADLGVACAQVVLAAFLGASLAASRAHALRTLAAALPFTALAAALAGTGVVDASRTAVVTYAWIATCVALRGPFATGIATLLTVGGPLLWYIAIEYGQRSVPLGSWITTATPALGLCWTRLHGDLLGPLATAGTGFLIACASSGLSKRVRLVLHAMR